MGLSNSALGYLNYPTQVMFKCCKLIPVLIGGILIQGAYLLLSELTIISKRVIFCLTLSLTSVFGIRNVTADVVMVRPSHVFCYSFELKRLNIDSAQFDVSSLAVCEKYLYICNE